MEPPTRIELVTSSLPWMRSTTELGWHCGAGCRIRTYEGISQQIYSLSCLTASLTLHELIVNIKMEPPIGFEPMTYGLQNRRSNQLS